MYETNKQSIDKQVHLLEVEVHHYQVLQYGILVVFVVLLYLQVVCQVMFQKVRLDQIVLLVEQIPYNRI